MPPPNFARKKRKSRSRGASAKRASHTRGNQPNQKGDSKRSSSFDVSSKSSRDVKEDISGQNFPLLTSESETSHNVAAFASGSAGTTIKSQPSICSQKNSNKSSRSAHCSNFEEGAILYNSNSQDLNLGATVTTSIMGQEDEKLNSLCRLLERLDSTYGKYSYPNSPNQAKGDMCLSRVQNGEITHTSSQKRVCAPLTRETSNKVAERFEKKEQNSCDLAQENLTPAEKQALRKAKKEAKKFVKMGKADPEGTSVSIKSCTTTVSPLNSQNIKQKLNQTSSVVSSKSKTELKRERREKQEAQRASKEAEKTKQNVKKSAVITPAKVESPKTNSVVKKNFKPKRAALYDRHLPLLEHLSTSRVDCFHGSINSLTVHPTIRAAGLSMKDFTVDGCLSRILATLSAICSLIEDYQTPPSCDLSRDLSNQLSPNIAFLHACRPISEPLNNAIRFVKREVNKVDSSVPERKAKQDLLEAINTYIHQNIILASKAIIHNAQEFLEDHDIVLTFGFSSLVLDTVKAASKTKKKLSVIVVDNPGAPSGIYLLQSLIELGVKVYYRILPDLPHIINKVTKVVVEAEAVVLNGAVIGRCGMAGLILLASTHSVPVIVLSHTFKFCNIDLTDSLVVNELGSSAAIVDCPSSSFKGFLAEWKDIPSLNVVNLIYDVTPSQLISVLVTELNNFPTSVVPVIIKRNYADILGHD